MLVEGGFAVQAREEEGAAEGLALADCSGRGGNFLFRPSVGRPSRKIDRLGPSEKKGWPTFRGDLLLFSCFVFSLFFSSFTLELLVYFSRVRYY